MLILWLLYGLPTATELQFLLLIVVAILGSAVLHEFAHAMVAFLLGDHSQEDKKRLTLNPINQLSWKGSLCLLVTGFVVWAKPVYVEEENLKNPKKDMAIIAFAGPAMIFLLAFLLIFVMEFFTRILLFQGMLFDGLEVLALINIFLAIFNLIPLVPLDGSKIVYAFVDSRTFDKTITWQLVGLAFVIIVILFFDGLGIIDTGFYQFIERILYLMKNFVRMVF